MDSEPVLIKVRVTAWKPGKHTIRIEEVCGDVSSLNLTTSLKVIRFRIGVEISGKLIEGVLRKHKPEVGNPYWLQLTEKALKFYGKVR